ncbi:MAG TPA: tripartite tricarboxylate transporter substrate binding protein [Xanthobacteraceae bacterium]|nr:tripartite tricarboxylate transporter substrate binding protein [Xanthobacteraceae bacterium]
MKGLSRRTLLAVALPALAARAARAEDPDAYPTHSVTFVVPFAPGGGTDTLARLLGQKLQEQFSQPFLVQNRSGEGTVIATNFVAKSPADGYTIMMAVSTLAIDVTLYKKLPYDPAKDLCLVALVASVPFVLVVNPSLQVYSVDDLIELAKKKSLSFGSGGIGAFHHLAGEYFASMTGIKLRHVPYRGTVPALNDVVGGYIQLMFTDLGPAEQLIASGKLRPLAVTTKTRLAALPNVLPLNDVGVPGFDLAAWQGVIAPAATPSEIILKLNAQLNTLVGTPEVRGRINDLGMNPIGTGNPDELASFLQADITRWAKIVETAGIAKSE